MVISQQNVHDSSKTIITDINIEETVDDIEPPPLPLTARFKNLQDWLTNICDHDKPGKHISKLRFGLSESINSYTLFLVGVNHYQIDKTHGATRIEFEPVNMYFGIPPAYYKNLNREQVLAKLSRELKSFTSTKKFKNSFFTKADSVVFDPNSQTLWSK